MYQMEKHSSLDDLPNVPFFTGYRKKPVQLTPENSTLSMCSSVINQPAISPPQKIQMRGESIKQVAGWHSLLKQGIVSQKQYD